MHSFIIYSPRYSEKNGGSIVLHYLCDQLNKMGVKAYIYPMASWHTHTSPLKKIRSFVAARARKMLGIDFLTNPNFDTPIAKQGDFKNSIIVYPEVVIGNPLKGTRVVRWLLYKVARDAKTVEWSNSDLCFYFQEAFKINNQEINYGGQLQVMHLRDDLYRRFNYSTRSGVCHAVRKGKNRKIVHELKNSICIDKLPHEEIARLFNTSERFISYDPYTLYSQYAAMCGCISVVVPNANQTKEQWQPIEGLRLGIAYGFDDIDWARQTADQVAPYLAEQGRAKNNSIAEFVKTCDSFFKGR